MTNRLDLYQLHHGPYRPPALRRVSSTTVDTMDTVDRIGVPAVGIGPGKGMVSILSVVSNDSRKPG